MQDELKPVAFLYSRDDGSKDLVLDCNGEYARRLLELGATETPLYAHPPTTNPVAVSETPVGDHQMVEAVDRVLIEAIINDYHTTRLDRDYVPHILSKPRTVEAFARHRQSALTAARAQVEAENQRLREALAEINNLPGEINPSNYDHDDVCELNRQFVYSYEIARQVLAQQDTTDAK